MWRLRQDWESASRELGRLKDRHLEQAVKYSRALEEQGKASSRERELLGQVCEARNNTYLHKLHYHSVFYFLKTTILTLDVVFLLFFSKIRINHSLFPPNNNALPPEPKTQGCIQGKECHFVNNSNCCHNSRVLFALVAVAGVDYLQFFHKTWMTNP